MNDFPLPIQQLTINQQLVLKEYEELRKLASALDIGLTDPEAPHLEDEDPSGFSHNLVADTFVLDLGIVCWDDDEAGPVVGLALRFGDNGNRVELSYSVDADWTAEATLEDDDMDWEPIKALAKNLVATGDPSLEAIQIDRDAALRVAKRMFVHYLAHRLPC